MNKNKYKIEISESDCNFFDDYDAFWYEYNIKDENGKVVFSGIDHYDYPEEIYQINRKNFNGNVSCIPEVISDSVYKKIEENIYNKLDEILNRPGIDDVDILLKHLIVCQRESESGMFFVTGEDIIRENKLMGPFAKDTFDVLIEQIDKYNLYNYIECPDFKLYEIEEIVSEETKYDDIITCYIGLCTRFNWLTDIERFPELSQCKDFNIIKENFDFEMLNEIENTINDYLYKDNYVKDGELVFKDKDNKNLDILRWFECNIETKEFIEIYEKNKGLDDILNKAEKESYVSPSQKNNNEIEH